MVELPIVLEFRKTAPMKKIKSRKDIIIILILSGMAIVFLIISKLTAGSGNRVFVYVDGKVFAEYDLNEDNVYEIDTEYGKNVITIKDSRVSVSSADCSNQICVNHNPISKSNESIICLPNHLVVRIRSGETGEIDDIAK